MTRLAVIATLALILALALGAASSPEPAPGGDAGCRGCHSRMASPMPPAGHGDPLACTACHQGRGQSAEQDQGHAGLIANPSALDQAPKACGACHPGWPQKVAASPMATNMGLINQTRYLWGAQESLEPRYGARAGAGLEMLPHPAQSGQAVDDLLRRRCLRCHLGVPGADMEGARRSAGCAACHRPRDAQGHLPQGHGLTRKVPVSQCLTCHAGCGAGGAYVGLVPRDDDPAARFLETDPQRPRLWQGRAWRPMTPDLHHQAGLACIDCHVQSEIMGDGGLRAAGLLHVGLRCATCHGTPGQPPRQVLTTMEQPLNNIRPLEGGGWLLTAKLDGRARAIPMLGGGALTPVAHRVPQHGRVACHACHNALNPADWGWQVLLETRPRYQQWAPQAAQGDPQVLSEINGQLALPEERRRPPQSRDWLNGETRPGLWLVAPWFRRFEWRLYGQGPDGKSYLLAPRFQYVLTSLDQEGRVLESSRPPRTAQGLMGLGLTPWHAHSVQRATPGCAACHGAARVWGLGLTFLQVGAEKEPPRLAPSIWRPRAEGLDMDEDWLNVLAKDGQPRQTLLVPGARFYSGPLLERLLRPGKQYRRWLLQALEEEWPGPVDAPSQSPSS